ncbi:MAG: hypothetical protein ACPG31_08585 [Planctomycetota bacterium]
MRLLSAVALFALMGLGIFALMLNNWTAMESLDDATAEQRFAIILEEMVDPRPYLTLAAEGRLEQHAEVLPAAPAEIAALAVVAWNPTSKRWIRTDFPFWFVRMKMQGGITVGVLHAALGEDWDHLQLRLDAKDLAARGPGLLLDLQEEDGRRFLLWNTEGEKSGG